MSESVRPLVVIGVGNVLLRDDGIGVRVIEGLRRLQEQDAHALPQVTHLVDGGSMLIDLLHAVRDGRGLVLVDAVRLGGQEGLVSVQRDDDIAFAGDGYGQATNSVAEMLALAHLMGWLPERIALVGIEVEQTEFGSELSPVIAAALPRAIETVRDELRLMDELLAARDVPAATPVQPRGAQA